VILEIEKNATNDVLSSKSRRSLRSLVRRSAQNDSAIPSSSSSLAQSTPSQSAKTGVSQSHSAANAACHNVNLKAGPFGIRHETATIKKSTSHFENFANFVKTNPVARKLRLLAPGDSYHDLDSRLRVAKWFHQGLPKYAHF